MHCGTCHAGLGHEDAGQTHCKVCRPHVGRKKPWIRAKRGDLGRVYTSQLWHLTEPARKARYPPTEGLFSFLLLLAVLEPINLQMS